jgi:hypothetical protein
MGNIFSNRCQIEDTTQELNDKLVYNIPSPTRTRKERKRQKYRFRRRMKKRWVRI